MTHRRNLAGAPVLLMSLLLVLAGCLQAGPVATVVTLDATRTYQTFAGWESAVLPSVLDYTNDLPAFGALFDDAAENIGITRLRVGISSGIEGRPGFGAKYLSGEITENQLFREHAYRIVNDNADPSVANLDAFEFTLLDWQMEHIVVPYRRRLAAAGRQLYVYLTYVDFGASPFEHRDHPEEYGELMLVVFDHLKTTFGFVPDGIDVINEPDLASWTGRDIGRVVAATAPRLAAAGYHPNFITPSTTDRGRAVPFLNEALAVPGAADHITHLSYHCYRDSGTNSLAAIARKASDVRIATMMNECWEGYNSYRALHQDLKTANDSGWQQGTLNGKNGYYAVDAAARTVALNPQTRVMSQYYRHIRPGAVRIEATTTSTAMDPVAFINADGRYVTIILAESAGAVTVERLPAGTYALSYSTETAFNVSSPDVTLSSGQPLSVAIPAAGVITVHAR